MITSADNPKVKQARSLLERRGRAQQGYCLAEGVRLIEDAMRARVIPALIFYAPAARESDPAGALLDAAATQGIACWEVSPAVFATLSDTVSSQGLVAVLPIPDLPAAAEPWLILVLDQVRDPGNLGTLLRSAAAAGVESVYLTVGCTDPWAPKVLRAGMGAHFRVPIHARAIWSAIAQVVSGRPFWLADAAGETSYDAVDWTGPTVLALGGETAGFGSEARDLSRGRVAIPMPGGAESLNVAMAGTVLLFEAARQRRRFTRARSG